MRTLKTKVLMCVAVLLSGLMSGCDSGDDTPDEPAYEFEYAGVFYTVSGGKGTTCRTRPGSFRWLDAPMWEEGGSYELKPGNRVEGILVIPDSVTDGDRWYKVTEVGDFSFAGADGLVSVSLSAAVKTIGVGAFAKCLNLANVDFQENLNEIGRGAFYRCAGLTELNLPNSLAVIGEDRGEPVDFFFGAFEQCRGLTGVVVKKKVEYIGGSTFAGCRNLAEVKLENSSNGIGFGDFAFSDSGLVEFKSARPLIMIPRGFLSFCSKLRTLHIPSDVETIGGMAFVGCGSLIDVIYDIPSPKAFSNAASGDEIFSDYTYRNATLYVGRGGKLLAQNREPWQNFSQIEEL